MYIYVCVCILYTVQTVEIIPVVGHFFLGVPRWFFVGPHLTKPMGNSTDFLHVDCGCHLVDAILWIITKEQTHGNMSYHVMLY